MLTSFNLFTYTSISWNMTNTLYYPRNRKMCLINTQPTLLCQFEDLPSYFDLLILIRMPITSTDNKILPSRE